MKEKEITATTGSKKDGTLKEFKGKVRQAESWPEAIKIAGDETKALALFNRQVATDALNALRKPSVDPWEKLMKALPAEAAAEIAKIKSKYQK